jgi:hypothetical protein
MTSMVTAPEDNRNFFILKPLFDEVAEELAICRQMKRNRLYNMQLVKWLACYLTN